MTATRIYIEELANEDSDHYLGRAAHTIRQWVNQGHLPKRLMPGREGGRQRMYWTPGQINGLKDFARAREERRGWQHGS